MTAMENQLAQANAELKSAREAAALAKAAAAKAASAPPSPAAAAATAAEITALQAQLRQVLAQKDALQEVRSPPATPTVAPLDTQCYGVGSHPQALKAREAEHTHSESEITALKRRLEQAQAASEHERVRHPCRPPPPPPP